MAAILSRPQCAKKHICEDYIEKMQIWPDILNL